MKFCHFGRYFVKKVSSRLSGWSEKSFSQCTLSYEHSEIFTNDLGVCRDLGNRASPVNRAHNEEALSTRRVGLMVSAKDPDRAVLEILLGASCYRNRDKLRPDEISHLAQRQP